MQIYLIIFYFDISPWTVSIYTFCTVIYQRVNYLQKCPDLIFGVDYYLMGEGLSMQEKEWKTCFTKTFKSSAGKRVNDITMTFF